MMPTLKTSWCLRWAGTGLAFGILFVMVPMRDLGSALAQVPLPLVAFSLLGLVLGHVVAATKWWLLLAPVTGLGWSESVRAHFAGQAATIFLPGMLGGDMVRVAWAWKKSRSGTAVAVATFSDRLIDCVALLLLAALGASMAAKPAFGWNQVLVVWIILVGVAILGGAALMWWRRNHPRAEGIIERAAAAIDTLRKRPWLLASTLGMSLAVQGSFVAINAWIGSAAGVHVGAAAWLVAWPIAKLIASLPISFAGLGVRESALVSLLAPFGAPSGAVFASGLLWQALMLSGGLFGAALAFLSPRPTPQPSEI